jgi:hypothetical protein
MRLATAVAALVVLGLGPTVQAGPDAPRPVSLINRAKPHEDRTNHSVKGGKREVYSGVRGGAHKPEPTERLSHSVKGLH